MMHEVDRPALKAALLDLAFSGQLVDKEENLISQPQNALGDQYSTEQIDTLGDAELSVVATVYSAAEDEEMDATALSCELVLIFIVNGVKLTAYRC